MFRSTGLRLAALYTAAFALAVIVLGVLILGATRAALAREFDVRIGAEAEALVREYRTEGLQGVVQAVRERDATPGSLAYGLQAASGQPIVGRLAGVRAPPGFSILNVEQPDEEPEPVRILSTVLPDGGRLLLGEDRERISVLDDVLLRGFGAALVGVVLLGVAGGYLLNRDLHRRLAAISGTAEAIIDGDLSRRVPRRGSGDDLDRLAATINRMLDRISALMDSLRQVSSDVAHDLRTPLTRLRQRLESSLGDIDPGSHAVTLEAALDDLDAILATFAALLRISQIEGGARRAAFRQVDIWEVAATVAEAFAPSAEEQGHVLELEGSGPVVIVGDRELLTQMLVNLVENAIVHTARGARIRIRVRLFEGEGEIAVLDDGPGVPADERERLFDRFYRLERSRSTAGSGLGLALVAAVARLHQARAVLLDAGPGLEARVTFAGGAEPTLRNPNVTDTRV